MARLVDADALIQWIDENECYTDRFKRIASGIIENRPTVDAIPVVRCRECGAFRPLQDGGGLCWNTGYYVPEEGFCHDGERKGGDE